MTKEEISTTWQIGDLYQSVLLEEFYEKILDKCSKEHNIIQHYCIQKGFINKPGTYTNTNVLNNILNDAKQKKKDWCSFVHRHLKCI